MINLATVMILSLGMGTSQFGLSSYVENATQFTNLPSNYTGNVVLESAESTLYWREFAGPFGIYDTPKNTVVTTTLLFVDGALEETDYEVAINLEYVFTMSNRGGTNLLVDDFKSGSPINIPCTFAGPYLYPNFGPVDILTHAEEHWGWIIIQPYQDGYLVQGTSNSNVIDTTVDGIVDSNDLSMYLDWFFEGDSAADISQDGVVDSNDLFDYFNRYFTF